jgi:hypothetical protein
VSLGSLWSLSLVASPSLSVTSQQHYPLSPGGLKTPSTLHSWSGSTAGRSPTLFEATQPLSPPCSMHKAPGKGGCSQPAINLRTSCASLGLAHHHTPPSSLAVLPSFIFTWASPKQSPLLFTPTFLSRAIAHNHCLTRPSPSLSNTTLSLPPY